jgi:hypothetical protein
VLNRCEVPRGDRSSPGPDGPVSTDLRRIHTSVSGQQPELRSTAGNNSCSEITCSEIFLVQRQSTHVTLLFSSLMCTVSSMSVSQASGCDIPTGMPPGRPFDVVHRTLVRCTSEHEQMFGVKVFIEQMFALASLPRYVDQTGVRQSTT